MRGKPNLRQKRSTYLYRPEGAVPLLQQSDQRNTALGSSFREPAPVQGWNKDATAVDGPEMTTLSLPGCGQEPEDRAVTPGVCLGRPAGFSRGLIPF